MDLAGQVALVIGGASGMGLASARELAGRGARVVIADRDGVTAAEQAGALKQQGMAAVAHELDARSSVERGRLFASIEAAYGGLNVLFNTLGSHGPAGLDHDEQAYDETFELNVKVHYYAVIEALPLLRARAPKSCVVLMSSAGGLRYGGRAPLYATTKAAVIMMARALARELGPAGIRVHALCPGPVDTPFGGSDRDAASRAEAIAAFEREIPLRRVAVADDIGRVVGFLASDAGAYLTGLTLPVDGGLLA
jgi:NAD(P)-dependent dehydrogenase (short-subunit alcohol dehydrogenase family)